MPRVDSTFSGSLNAHITAALTIPASIRIDVRVLRLEERSTDPRMTNEAPRQSENAGNPERSVGISLEGDYVDSGRGRRAGTLAKTRRSALEITPWRVAPDPPEDVDLIRVQPRLRFWPP